MNDSEELKDPNAPKWRDMLRQVLVASDDAHKLWSEDEVNFAQHGFAQHGGIPSLSALYQHFGKEPLDRVMHELIQERASWLQFQAALKGENSPCFSCGSTTDLQYFDFGLAHVVKSERDWTSVGISAAVSAVTIPLLGRGLLYGPGKTQTANILRMRLVLCNKCVDKQRGLFGGFSANASHCSIHPLWNQLQEAGFTKFIDQYDLKSWY